MENPFTQRMVRRPTWSLVAAAFILFSLLISSLYAVKAVSAEGSIKYVGTVTSSPGSTDGTGLWVVLDKDGVSHTVLADGDTEFDSGIPKTGDEAEFIGEEEDPNLLATEIKLLDVGGDDGTSGDDGDEVEGTVLTRPDGADGIGTWTLQTELFITETVIANSATRFDKGIPAIGTWVEAEGTRQTDGTIVASRIRPDEYEDGELVVWLKPGVLSSTIEIKYDLEAKSTLLAEANIFLFSTEDDDEPDLATTIQADPDVIWAEVNYVQSVPEDDGYSTWGWGGTDPEGYTNQQAFAQVNFLGAQAKYDGDGIVVAVLDTGIALTHTSLMTQLLPGLDVIADDPIPQDEGAGQAWGHGTHVAGIISYIAPGSRILPIRVLDTNGRGNTFLLAYAIDWAIKQGADVINLSLGTEGDSKILKDMIAEAIGKGIVVVAAAGNHNQEAVRFPAAYDGVLAITAVDSASHKATFSNYGSWIKLAAPGVGITSTVTGPQGQGFASWSGTSMAAPFVSGAAALLQQKYAGDSGQEASARLISTAVSLSASNPSYSGKLGGLLDIDAALSGELLYLPSVQN